MNKTFNDKELEYIYPVWTKIDEVFIEMRKNVPQTKYVIEIKQDLVWCNEKEELINIPEELVGIWMESSESDNTMINASERLGLGDSSYRTSWVKVKKIEKITYSYEEL